MHSETVEDESEDRPPGLDHALQKQIGLEMLNTTKMSYLNIVAITLSEEQLQLTFDNNF